ncbi:MAG: hypothetical protein HQL59_11820 [Magnetococcales bacterium]|nr:hypothetical protein [Magnetococcales bacterium]
MPQKPTMHQLVVRVPDPLQELLNEVIGLAERFSVLRYQGIVDRATVIRETLRRGAESLRQECLTEQRRLSGGEDRGRPMLPAPAAHREESAWAPWGEEETIEGRYLR